MLSPKHFARGPDIGSFIIPPSGAEGTLARSVGPSPAILRPAIPGLLRLCPAGERHPVLLWPSPPLRGRPACGRHGCGDCRPPPPSWYALPSPPFPRRNWIRLAPQPDPCRPHLAFDPGQFGVTRRVTGETTMPSPSLPFHGSSIARPAGSPRPPCGRSGRCLRGRMVTCLPKANSEAACLARLPKSWRFRRCRCPTAGCGAASCLRPER